MRIVSFALLVGIFVVAPFVLLQTAVMPQLESLKFIYSHADEIATNAVK